MPKSNASPASVVAQRSNPFQPIYDICNAGGTRFKRLNPIPFPRYLDVELTNHCNFRCLMCYTGTGMSSRPRGYMREEVFRRLLKEVSPWGTPLRFIRWGEPTLHPRWLEYFSMAKELGLPLHLTTNGSRLDDGGLQALVDLPVDAVKFSFQGVDAASYQQMRGLDFFEDLMGVIQRLHLLRGDRLLPFVQVSTSTTYESEDQRVGFRERISKFADQVLVGRTSLDRLDLDKVRLGPQDRATLMSLKDKQSIQRTHAECHEVFDKLSVNWDGSISACCGDHDNLMVVGHLMKGGLEEAWRSPAMEGYRNTLVEMRHQELELCQTCYDVHGLRSKAIHRERPSGPGA